MSIKDLPPYFDGSTPPAARLYVGDAADILRPGIEVPWHSMVTSLPDQMETTMSVDAWRAWFIETVMLCTMTVDPEGVVVFAQTDRLHDRRWISKADLVFQGLARVGARMLWHKIAFNTTGVSLRRPAFTHLIAAGWRAGPGPRTPDVVPGGPKDYPNAIGRDAIDLIYRSIEHIPAPVIGDPFCGRGSLLLGAVRTGRDVVGGDIDEPQVIAATATLRPFADVRWEGP